MSLVGKWFGFARDEIFDEALRAYERGDDEMALEALEEFLSNRPTPDGEQLAHFYLANSSARLSQRFAEKGDIRRALPLIERALILSPTYPDLHLQAAALYGSVGEEVAEAASVASALRLNPSYRSAILYDLALQARKGQAEEVFVRISEERCLGSDDLTKASKAFAEADRAGAIAYLQAAALDNFTKEKIHLRVGDSYFRSGFYQEAAELYEQALRVTPHYADVRCRFGRCLYFLDKLPQAEAEFREAIRLNDYYAEAHVNLGNTLRRLNLLSDASTSFHRALELSPGDKEAAIGLALLG